MVVCLASFNEYDKTKLELLNSVRHRHNSLTVVTTLNESDKHLIEYCEKYKLNYILIGTNIDIDYIIRHLEIPEIDYIIVNEDDVNVNRNGIKDFLSALKRNELIGDKTLIVSFIENIEFKIFKLCRKDLLFKPVISLI